MPQDGELAAIIPLHRPRKVDIDAPFEKYSEAGLANAQFGIDGVEPLFWGYHNRDHRWNGWATPGFIHEVAGLVADWLNEDEVGTAWWEGDVLVVRSVDGGYVDSIEPDVLGLYRFDGWTWLCADSSS